MKTAQFALIILGLVAGLAFGCNNRDGGGVGAGTHAANNSTSAPGVAIAATQTVGTGPQTVASANREPKAAGLDIKMATKALGSYLLAVDDPSFRSMLNDLSKPPEDLHFPEFAGGAVFQVGPARINLEERTWRITAPAGNIVWIYDGVLEPMKRLSGVPC